MVGVGTGADLPYLDRFHAHVTGIDLSPEMLDQAKKKSSPGMTLLEMNAEKQEFPDQSF